ncbi:hypothetical protein [Alkalinema sp. FACHB-956]|uniref:hypothetical protein n=1 Tax=Alkalinema sp. FACHB-956 TaxID=2692768 RepID=UPI0016894606|nr:hypothetical protein [Alkalinema sp. FACHB-956]MBD2329243.1 hypothetical protein [Alkalinema sp. FACHB-956]
MKLLTSTTLSAALLLAIVPTALATGEPSAVTSQVTPPVTLVQLAQQGYLTQQGIPSNGDLVYAVQIGRITPETLVQAGIQAGQVPSDTLQNEAYLNVVREQLRDLISMTLSKNIAP